MKFFFILFITISSSALFAQSFQEMLEQVKPKSTPEELVKKEDCKYKFVETKDGLGTCDIEIDLDLLNNSSSKIKPVTESKTQKKRTPYIKNSVELNRMQLDLIVTRFHFLMSQKDDSIKDLQVLLKGFPIKYDDLVTSLFKYYLKGFTKFNNKENMIDGYLDNCTKLSMEEKKFIRMFLILDFNEVKIIESKESDQPPAF